MMIAELYGHPTRRPPFLGRLGNDCGPRPVQSDYLNDYDRPDTAAYRADLADWLTCTQQPIDSSPGAAPAAASAPAPPPAETGDDAIATQALSWTSSIGMDPSTYASWKAQVVAALGAGILDPGGQYATSSGKCAGSSAPAGPSDLQDAATAIGAATPAASIGAMIAGASSVVPIIGIVGSVAGLFISLIGKLFGPPVSELEQHTLCPAVSAANAILKQITAELKAGYITAAQANGALQQVISSFTQQVSSIEYIQTPNDTQLMVAELDALGVKNATVYSQLEQQASGAKAQVQAAAAAAQQAEIDAAVQSAVAQALPQEPVRPAPAPASIPASAAVTQTPLNTGFPPTAKAPTPSTASWFSESTAIGSLEIPNWLLLVGGGLLLAGGL